VPRPSDKRERLLAAARDLIHRQGYARTTLAQIAEVSDVPLGNVYYYFKTKEDIVGAIIDEYQERARQMAQGWEVELSPRQRLEAYLDVPVKNCDQVKAHGCPIGSLAQELSKDAPALKARADRLLMLHVQWLARQFEALGQADGPALARYVLATLQGASLLANSLGDDGVIKEQVARLKAWLSSV
jgi:AcrR family transcriptional regulator